MTKQKPDAFALLSAQLPAKLSLRDFFANDKLGVGK